MDSVTNAEINLADITQSTVYNVFLEVAQQPRSRAAGMGGVASRWLSKSTSLCLDEQQSSTCRTGSLALERDAGFGRDLPWNISQAHKGNVKWP
jgi:hypothetical protein